MNTQNFPNWDEEQLIYLMPPSPPDLTEIYEIDSEDEYTPIIWTDQDLEEWAIFTSNHPHIEGVMTVKPRDVFKKVE